MPAREGGLVLAAFRPDPLALLGEDDRGARVLAHRQHAARRDVRVLQHVERHELVVRGGFRVVEDRAQLLQVRGPQQMRDVVESLGRDQGQRLGRDGEHALPLQACGPDMIGGELAVGRLVGPEREHLLELEFRHSTSRHAGLPRPVAPRDS